MIKEISIADALTNEVIVREMNDDELSQWQKDQERRAALRAQEQLLSGETQAKREAALSKLAALGLTSEDLKALGL